MNILAFKMSNGDEIIAKVTDDRLQDSHRPAVTIANPLALKVQMTAGGAQIGFFDWALMAPEDSELNLNLNQIVCWYKPKDEVAKDYIKNTTGIDIMTSPKILYS